MGAVSWSQELSSPVAPVRLFKALCLDSHNLFPKLAPQGFKSIEFVKGDRVAVGAIKQVNFSEGISVHNNLFDGKYRAPFKYAMHKIEELDVEKLYCMYSTPEGDVLEDKVDHVIHEVKFSPSAAGSVCTMSWHYHPKEGAVLEEEMLKKGQGKAMDMFKVVDEYLIANPNAYA